MLPKACGDRVLVRDPEHQQVMKSGLILVGGKSVDVVCSEIISLGPNVKDKTLRAGDRVLHTRVTGVKIDSTMLEDYGLPHGHYRFVKEEELFAVLAPGAEFESGTGFYDDKNEFHTTRS